METPKKRNRSKEYMAWENFIRRNLSPAFDKWRADGGGYKLFLEEVGMAPDKDFWLAKLEEDAPEVPESYGWIPKRTSYIRNCIKAVSALKQKALEKKNDI